MIGYLSINTDDKEVNEVFQIESVDFFCQVTFDDTGTLTTREHFAKIMLKVFL